MKRPFDIVSSLVLLFCFFFNSLMGVSLNENLSFSINHQNSKLSDKQFSHPVQLLSSSDSDTELILENELEDNEEQLSEATLNFDTFRFTPISEEHEYLLSIEGRKPQSLNILYCVLRI